MSDGYLVICFGHRLKKAGVCLLAVCPLRRSAVPVSSDPPSAT